ncbi:hypothetical protein TRVL_06185 [Trypanosoma vivax]|nr:hypothetical protein TRVL_06185 [Trypanosoma vivax]
MLCFCIPYVFMGPLDDSRAFKLEGQLPVSSGARYGFCVLSFLNEPEAIGSNVAVVLLNMACGKHPGEAVSFSSPARQKCATLYYTLFSFRGPLRPHCLNCLRFVRNF